jgi:DNA-binding winged helix-turn-helix (wHTH) protein/tetratricopeptide (TPR) repeat protein
MASNLRQEKVLYGFDHYRLDPAQRILMRDHDLIPLTPKAFDMLLALVESEGRVVEKEELLRRVWPGTFVEEGSLTQTISVLRRTLGQTSGGPQYIQTISKRGYRFEAPVTVTEVLPEPRLPHPEPNARPGDAAEPQPSPRAPVSSRLRFYLVGILVAVILAFVWNRTRPSTLTDQDVVVLADFTNLTGDAALDGTLRDALAFQLEQSPFLKVLEDDVVRQDLRLMRRLPEERITNDAAHDICVREAAKMMLSGSIAVLGKTYLIELKAANCRAGTTLARQEAQAPDKEHILAALAKAAQGMRAKLGESLASIQKLAPPDFQVTTSSIEAFQAFEAGRRLFLDSRYADAVPFFERATELDPAFAIAYKFLASASMNTPGARPQVTQELADKAYALRDRVSPYERFWIGGPGYLKARSEQDLQNLELWIRTYPRDPAPLVFAEIIHASRGEFEPAMTLVLQAYRMAPRRPLYASLLMNAYIRLDQFDEAKAVAQDHFSRGFDNTQVHQLLLRMSWIRADQAGAAKQMEWFSASPEEYKGLEEQAAHARMLGQLLQSRKLLQQAADAARRRSLADVAARLTAPDADGDALLGDCGPARRPAPPFATLGNHLASLAFCSSEAMVQSAEKRAGQLSKWRAGDSLWDSAQLPSIRAAIEFGRGKPAETIELLRSVQPYERAFTFATYLRGLAFLQLRKGTEAAAEFQKIVGQRGAGWGPLYPLSLLGRARGAVLSGDKDGARNAYERFLGLWKDADPELPILLQARREYSELLQ